MEESGPGLGLGLQAPGRVLHIRASVWRLECLVSAFLGLSAASAVTLQFTA